jgi:spore coat polysaccharide biosynthesis protein SpsF
VRTGVFLQARLGSQRLPRKALLPLAGRTMLEVAMEALARVSGAVHALLTDAASAEAFRPLAAGAGFELFVGPEDDVLERFCQATRQFAVDRVVRATGDNPLVSPLQAATLMDLHSETGQDLSHYLGPPLGTGVEIIDGWALLRAGDRARGAYEREHITQHLYRHRRRYRVGEFAAPPEWVLPEARVTVDTEEDYQSVRRLFAALYRGEPIETEELVRFLREGGR